MISKGLLWLCRQGRRTISKVDPSSRNINCVSNSIISKQSRPISNISHANNFTKTPNTQYIFVSFKNITNSSSCGKGFSGNFSKFRRNAFPLNSSRNIFLRYDSVSEKCFHTSPKRNALPPALVFLLTRTAKLMAMLFGRTMRRKWQNLTPEEKKVIADKIRRNRYIMSGLLGGAAFGCFVYYDSHVQETPFTKRRRFLAFTPDQFNEMSKLELEMMIQLHKNNIIPPSLTHPAYYRVSKVSKRLLSGNDDIPFVHDINWTITVVDDESNVNAFVLPCGSIFVYTGLLKVCETDDELGVILGHEMAHALMGHGSEKASLLHFMDLLMVIPLAAIWFILPTDIIAGFGHFFTDTLSKLVMELPHSRFIEHEADEVGLLLAAKACFDVRESVVLWDKMSLMQGGVTGATSELNLEWLSTHPTHDKRQAQLKELLPSALALREKCQCPRLPIFDPEFKLSSFRHKMKMSSKDSFVMPVKVR